MVVFAERGDEGPIWEKLMLAPRPWTRTAKKKAGSRDNMMKDNFWKQLAATERRSISGNEDIRIYGPRTIVVEADGTIAFR